jgi:hypothetical protein
MATTVAATPGLSSFLKSLKHADVETSIEHFISYVLVITNTKKNLLLMI